MDVTVMKKLFIADMYRGYDNEKLHQTAILGDPDNEPVEFAEAHIRDLLDSGEFFSPDRDTPPPVENCAQELHEPEYVEVYEG
jgi:hypothetical protein